MSAGLLEYALTLDVGGFDKSMQNAIGKLHNFGHEAQQSGTHLGSLIGPLAKVAAAVGSVAVAAIGFEKFKHGVESAFEMGHALEHVAEATDETVAHIAVFQQALKDTGGSADQAEGYLFRFEKALSGVNEEGQSTDAVFKAMGLNMESLRSKMPLEALEEFRKSYAQFGKQDQNKILTEAFGKQGKDLKPFLGKDNAMANAAVTVGSQAGILERNAATFSRVAALLNSAGMKMQGFYVGVAEKLEGPLLRTLEAFNKLDFAPLGAQFGTIISIWTDSISILFKGMGTDFQSLQQRAKGFLDYVRDASDRIKGVVMIVRGAFEHGDGLELIGLSIESGILHGINAFTSGIMYGVDYMAGALPVLFNSLVDILTNNRIKMFFTSIFHGLGDLLEASMLRAVGMTDKAQDAEETAAGWFRVAGVAARPNPNAATALMEAAAQTAAKANAAGLANARGKDHEDIFDTSKVDGRLAEIAAKSSRAGLALLKGQTHTEVPDQPAEHEKPKGTKELNLNSDKDAKIGTKRREWELENVLLSARGMHQRREIELAEHQLKLEKMRAQLMEEMKYSEQEATEAAERRLSLEDRLAHKPVHALDLAGSTAKRIQEHGEGSVSQADKLALAAANRHKLAGDGLIHGGFINPARAHAALVRAQAQQNPNKHLQEQIAKQDEAAKANDSLYRAVKSIEEKFAALAAA